MKPAPRRLGRNGMSLWSGVVSTFAALCALPGKAMAAVDQVAAAVDATTVGPLHATAALVVDGARALLCTLCSMAPGAGGPQISVGSFQIDPRLADLALAVIVALAVVAVVALRQRLARQKLALAQRIVERGGEPPVELFAHDPATDLRRGVVVSTAGLGTALVAGLAGPIELAVVAAIPTFIGVGYVLSWILTRGPDR